VCWCAAVYGVIKNNNNNSKLLLCSSSCRKIRLNTFVPCSWTYYEVKSHLRNARFMNSKVKVKVAHTKSYSIIERRVPELIPVLGSQLADDVGHKPDGRLPLLSARPAVTPATLKTAATNFATW